MKRGDSFFPPLNGGRGGLTIWVGFDNGITETPYDGLDITIQFRTYNGRLVKTLKTGNGITREGNGFYHIDTFIWEWPAHLYEYDIECRWPDGTIVSSTTGKLNVEQDISNSR